MTKEDAKEWLISVNNKKEHHAIVTPGVNRFVNSLSVITQDKKKLYDQYIDFLYIEFEKEDQKEVSK